MGQQFTVENITAAALNLIGQPIKGANRSADASTITDATETVFVTSPQFVPKANRRYLVLSFLSANVSSGAPTNGWWHRIRQDTVSGSEVQIGSFLPNVTGSAGPIPHFIGGWWSSGASPSAVQFVGTVGRHSGTASITPQDRSWIVPVLMGDFTDFVNI